MSQQPAFGTPLFAEKDICIFLSELGMSCSTEQLQKPTYEFVQPIYENLVTALMGVTRCARSSAGRCCCLRQLTPAGLGGRLCARTVPGSQAAACRHRRAAAAHPPRCQHPPAQPTRSEELQQPVFVAIDALEFPELHDESIPAVAFVRHLGRLLAAAGVRDFSLKVRA